MTPQQYAATLKGLGYSSNVAGKMFNTPGLGEAGTGLGAAGNVAGIYGGLERGGLQGDLGATTGLARLGTTNWGPQGSSGSALSHLGLNPDQVKGVNMGATGALDALAMYQGIKQGGWQGYGGAAGAGLQGAGVLLDMPGVAQAGGAILAPLQTYNMIKGWRSGATGSDALQGAETGAAWGSIIPGIGTVVGGLIGGAAGALSSAFGGGTTSQEAQMAQGYTGAYDKYDPATQRAMAAAQSPENNIQYLQGLMNAHNSSIGHESDLQAAFGKNNVGGFTDAMTQQINNALKSGTIRADATPDQIYQQVVAPWLATKSGGATSGMDVKGNAVGNPEQAAITNLIGQWQGGQFSGQTPVGVSGERLSGLQTYGQLGGLNQSPLSTLSAPTSGVSSMSDPAVLRAQQANSAATMKQMGLTPQQASAMSSGPVLDPATNYTTYLQGPNSTGSGALATINAANKAQSPRTAAALPSSQPSMTYNPSPAPMMQANEFGLHAEGGPMKKRKKSPLDELYRGNFKNRKHFDEGGSYYNFSGPSPEETYAPPETGGGGGDISTWGQGTGDPANQLDAYGRPPSDPNWGTVPGASDEGLSKETVPQSQTETQKQMAALKAKFSGDAGPLGYLKLLQGFAPLISAYAGRNSGANRKAPVAAPGMTQGASNPRPPTFNRTAVQNPSNLPGGAPMSLQDWYTYGSRPEAQFFNNNQVNLAGATGVAQGQAKGGSPLSMLGGQGQTPEFDSAQENYVQGPGDGTSDDIPAQLSDGEYVMDANTVSMLGNGSNKAGAARLDQLRENLRRHAAKTMKGGKQFMKAKAPEAYMRGGRK